MKIGVTGTRSGMNEQQKYDVTEWLIHNFKDGDELHHGDCIGVDTEVAWIAKRIGYKVWCHPPVETKLCGNAPSDVYHAPYSYFKRNRNIVDAVDYLMVVPYQDQRQDNGGTWYTYDYAVKKNKDLRVFYPGRSSTLPVD